MYLCTYIIVYISNVKCEKRQQLKCHLFTWFPPPYFIMCTFWSNFPLHNKDPNRPASNEGIFQPYPSRASQTDGAFFYVLHNSTNYKVNENYKSIKRRDWVYINSVFRRIEYQFTSKQDWNQTTISSWKL